MFHTLVELLSPHNKVYTSNRIAKTNHRPTLWYSHQLQSFSALWKAVTVMCSLSDMYSKFTFRAWDLKKKKKKNDLPFSSSVQFNVALRSQRPLRTIRVGEPRTATSTFTQLLNSGISVAAQSVFIRHVPPMTYCETPPALKQFRFRGRWSQ